MRQSPLMELRMVAAGLEPGVKNSLHGRRGGLWRSGRQRDRRHDHAGESQPAGSAEQGVLHVAISADAAQGFDEERFHVGQCGRACDACVTALDARRDRDECSRKTRAAAPRLAVHGLRARLSHVVHGRGNVGFAVPAGPFRCLPPTISRRPAPWIPRCSTRRGRGGRGGLVVSHAASGQTRVIGHAALTAFGPGHIVSPPYESAF